MIFFIPRSAEGKRRQEKRNAKAQKRRGNRKVQRFGGGRVVSPFAWSLRFPCGPIALPAAYSSALLPRSSWYISTVAVCSLRKSSGLPERRMPTRSSALVFSALGLSR